MCVNTTARAELNYRQVVVADMVHRYKYGPTTHPGIASLLGMAGDS